MKLFSRKPEADTLRTLDEKEIQKRLYGRYHRDSTVPTNSSNSNVNVTYPKLEIKVPSKSVSISTRVKDVLTHLQNSFSSVLKTFPWKLAGIVSVAFIISIVSFKALSFWLSRSKETSHHPRSITHVSKSAHGVYPAIVKPREVKKELVKTEAPKKPVTKSTISAPIATSISPLSPATPTEETRRKKYYSVQICTYQREQDAKQLTEELKNSGLPAFYLRTLSAQQQIPHYVVFLGKEETYAGASTYLKDFRRTQHFQKFPDSFIRSIS